MQVLNARDEALYGKLVRLAGGNAGIVMEVLSRPERSSVSLSTAIREIEVLRDRQRTAMADADADANAASAGSSVHD